MEQMQEIVPEEIAQEIKEAAEISMGTDILKEDIDHIKTLATSVYDIS